MIKLRPNLILICLGTIWLASPLHSQTTPTVSITPRNPSVSLGASVTFRATATGTAPISYLWRFNDVPLEVATNNTLVLTNIGVQHAGAFTVMVSNFSANTSGQNETLYRNKGDGTFAKITTGSIVNDGGNSAGAAWGDYDNDGFLDLFVGNWQGSRPNFLYRNNGNSNSWLKVKCVGTASNRDGIGARIRLKARIRGTDTWQLREISGGTGFGQTPLLGHFGLGDATTVDTLRIEWPSGAEQELHDVAIRRTITVVEPPQLQIRRTVDSMEICVIGDPAETYRVQSSENLSHWVERALLTNAVRTNVLHESSVAAHRFFRGQTVR